MPAPKHIVIPVGYQGSAQKALRTAELHRQEEFYPKVVSEAQSAIELAIKSVIWLYGDSAKWTHDPAPELYGKHGGTIASVLQQQRKEILAASRRWNRLRLFATYGDVAEGSDSVESIPPSMGEKAWQDARNIVQWTWRAMPFHPEAQPQAAETPYRYYGAHWIVADWMLRAKDPSWHGAPWPARDLAWQIAGLGRSLADRNLAVRITREAARVCQREAGQSKGLREEAATALTRLEQQGFVPEGTSAQWDRATRDDASSRDL